MPEVLLGLRRLLLVGGVLVLLLDLRDRLGLDPCLGGVVDAARQVAVGVHDAARLEQSAVNFRMSPPSLGGRKWEPRQPITGAGSAPFRARRRARPLARRSGDRPPAAVPGGRRGREHGTRAPRRRRRAGVRTRARRGPGTSWSSSGRSGLGFEMVKRVVGSPGEVVHLLPDGSRLPEPVPLREGEWFVVGDAPGASTDSRAFGPVGRRAPARRRRGWCSGPGARRAGHARAGNAGPAGRDYAASPARRRAPRRDVDSNEGNTPWTTTWS